ncbi:MAG TPA: DUF4399 domain-containing protein [Gemmatimonadales bacterium]|nr:DUF4399 domain-containing protein [Gemmatimonadales bacterium]
MRVSIPVVAALWVAALLPPAVQAQQAPPHQVTVKITWPKNGDTVTSPVTIKLTATGVRITPATVEQPGTGHHHLFVDHDLNWLTDTIPSGSPGIIHLSKGQSEFVLDSLKPGKHRVIALIADWRHIPLNPLVADTVTFTVK